MLRPAKPAAGPPIRAAADFLQEKAAGEAAPPPPPDTDTHTHTSRRFTGLLSLALALLTLALLAQAIIRHGEQAAPARAEARRWRYAVLRNVPLAAGDGRHGLPSVEQWRSTAAALRPAVWRTSAAQLGLPWAAAAAAPDAPSPLLGAMSAAGVRLARTNSRSVYARAAAGASRWCLPRYRRMLPGLPCAPASNESSGLPAPWLAEVARYNARGWRDGPRRNGSAQHHALSLEQPLSALLRQVWPDAAPLPATWPLPAAAARATDDGLRNALPDDFSAAMAAAAQAARDNASAPAMEPNAPAAEDAPPLVTCRVRFGHNGTELLEPWSTQHRFLVALEGAPRAVLLPGNEAHKLGLHPDGHPLAGQLRRSLRVAAHEPVQSMRGRLRTWVHPALTLGDVLYVPPGWVPVLIPAQPSLTAVCTLQAAAPLPAAAGAPRWQYSIVAERHRRVLAAQPPHLYNASLASAQLRHHGLRHWAVAAAGAATDDYFASPHHFLRVLHQNRLRLISFVYAEAPPEELARHPPLECAWRRLRSSTRKRRPSSETLAIRRQTYTYGSFVQQTYEPLPDATRQPLVEHALDAVIESVGGIHNLFLFYKACF